MNGFVYLIVASLTACSFEQHQNVDNTHDHELPTTIDLEPISELPQKPGDAVPTLINGKAADPKDFPASVYSSQGNSRCTATVVGQRALFIAAHCVANGGTANFRIGDERYTSKCFHSEDYARNATADYALCLVDRKVAGIPYEVLNTNPKNVQVGDTLQLTGFGCVNPGGTGGNDGVYRVGDSTVSRIPVGKDNDIHTSGPAALCYGDSGGPAFKYLDAEKKTRVQVSINSRGDIRRNSYLSAVYTEQATVFIKKWVTKYEEKICGFNTDATGCRGAPDILPPPPPPPPVDECKEAFTRVGQCLKLLSTTADDTCWKAYGRLFQCLDKSIQTAMEK